MQTAGNAMMVATGKGDDGASTAGSGSGSDVGDSMAALLFRRGIKVRDAIVLSFLYANSAASVVQLAREVGVEPRKVRTSLERLATAGMVQLQQGDTSDESAVSMTSDGAEVAARIRGQSD